MQANRSRNEVKRCLQLATKYSWKIIWNKPHLACLVHGFQVPQPGSSAKASRSPAPNSFQSKHSFPHAPRPLTLITSGAMRIHLEGFSWTEETTGVTLLPGVNTGAGTAFKPCVGSAHIQSLGLYTSPTAHLLTAESP